MADKPDHNPNPRVILVGLMTTGIENIRWKNFKKYNNKPEAWIIEDMKKRFLKIEFNKRNCRYIDFYNGATGNLIERHSE